MGVIVKPHGIRGETLVELHSEEPSRFAAESTLLVGDVPDQIVEMKVAESRPFGTNALVRFEGIQSRDAAETLRGSKVFVPARVLRSLEDDSFWEHELTGAQVFDTQHRFLGTIRRVVRRLEQDLWEVATERSTLMVPAAKAIVIEVDIEHHRVVIDPPEGLFDDDAI